jgi:hypothetical protein
LAEEYDLETFLDSAGGVHYSQEDADAENVRIGRTGKIGEAEGFKYGTEVAGGEDAEGNAITTDESLTGGYRGAYEQMLSDAYDASKTGVGYGILGSGGAAEIDPATGQPIDPYATLESAVEGQSTYLDGLSTAYQANAQTNYDDWLSTNTAAINDLTSLEDIEGYTWTDMPEFDTDFSGGIDPDTGAWDSDWMPEFYSGFNQEYGSDYIGDDSWQYDADGNPIAGTYATGTTGTTGTTDTTDGGGVTSAPASAAPGLKQSKKAAPGVAQFGSNRSAARYI